MVWSKVTTVSGVLGRSLPLCMAPRSANVERGARLGLVSPPELLLETLSRRFALHGLSRPRAPFGAQRAQSLSATFQFRNSAGIVVTYDQTTRGVTVTVGQDPRSILLEIACRLTTTGRGASMLL